MSIESADEAAGGGGGEQSAESGPLQSRSGNVIIKRNEQLVRWSDSETNKEKPTLAHSQRVKFHDCDIFMSACMAGDEAEVEALLAKGASVDTAAMDGLTALHQAVIEGNVNMVSFLLAKGANIDAQDNEGWTPLHAAACCNKVDIVQLLCENGADLSITNGDKDLPIDLCDDEKLQTVFAAQYEAANISPDACRHREEEAMLADARKWFAMGVVRDRPHPVTGATALHVAAAKGYMSVIKMLLQCNVPLNAGDKDGWTPLHAAAHWGETDACQALVDAHADMTLLSAAGQTCLDVADLQLLPVLEEMKAAVPVHHIVVEPPPKESSIPRLSMDERAAFAHKDALSERVEAVKVDSEACSEEADVSRKAKSKRERASRRSTQGVTVDQLEQARKSSFSSEASTEPTRPKDLVPASTATITPSVTVSTPPSVTVTTTPTSPTVWKSTALAQKASTPSPPVQSTIPLIQQSPNIPLATPARQPRRHRITPGNRRGTGPIENDDNSSVDSENGKVVIQVNRQRPDDKETNNNEIINYKLLYEAERLEKERLARRIADLEKSKMSPPDINEKEDARGALILQLRQDNDRLKQENGALIRVISKLSK